MDQKIETLIKVADTKNFTTAAKELNLTQPGVSHHIAQLEEEVGAKIFIRNRKGLQLTAEGEIVLRFARRIKAMEEKLLVDVADAKNHQLKLRVGITHTSESNKVAEVLARYSNENVGVSLTVITDTINNLYNLLDNYEIDLAIVEEQPHNPKLGYLVLGSDSLICMMANENPLAAKKAITWKELKKEKLILRLPDSETRKLFASSLKSINESIKDLDIIMEIDNIATIKNCVRNDLGVSILPLSVCQDDIRKKKLTALPIKNLSMVRQTFIVYHKDFADQKILQDILKMYQEKSKIA